MFEPTLRECLTFDDVMLTPGYSEVLPADVDVRTRLTRNISLNIPLISAAMDSVTEARSAISMAREGGLGVIHKNLAPEVQALEVAQVKRAESGIILDPITVGPSQSLREALAIMKQNSISGVPVVEGQTAGHLGQIDVTVPGHDITAPDGGGGGLEGYIGTGALAQQYGPDVSAALTRFTGDEPAIAALVHTIRIAHALYRPHHIVLAGGIGIRLNHVLTVIRQRVAHRLTSAARAGWTITCGDDDFHAARGTALLAESEAASRAAATNAAAAYAQLVERRSA